MKQLMENHWEWNQETDLIYSPYDGGWYFQRYPDHATSQLFKNQPDAVTAWHKDEIEWEV